MKKKEKVDYDALVKDLNTLSSQKLFERHITLSEGVVKTETLYKKAKKEYYSAFATVLAFGIFCGMSHNTNHRIIMTVLQGLGLVVQILKGVKMFKYSSQSFKLKTLDKAVLKYIQYAKEREKDQVFEEFASQENEISIEA